MTTSRSIFRKDGTAQGVAKQRLIETLAKPGERVVNDPYADRFVLGASIVKLMGHKLNVWLSQKLLPGFHEHLIARTRLIDDLVEKSAAGGVEQYVILGAGYDSRAHRLELPASLKIFEVDQSEVQAKKRSKISQKLPNSDNVTYVSVDFTHQTLTEQLRGAGFDLSKSTLFTLEGVSQYISKKAVSSTVEEIAALTLESRSIFFISYVDEILVSNPAAGFGKGYPNAEKRTKLVTEGSAKVGEPWISFYSAKEVENVLSKNGYSITENVTLEDLNSRYFAPVGRGLPEDQLFNLEHFVIAKSES